MKLENKWRNFLADNRKKKDSFTENKNLNISNVLKEVEFDIEEATAAKKRGIELPNMLEKLKRYSVSTGQKPTHYMHFSDLNKIGIKPQSQYETPLGIYFYPVNEEILGQLEKGKIPFASEREFLHVVKPNEGSEVLYVDESFTEQNLNEKLVKLFSEPVGEKLTKKMARKTPDGKLIVILSKSPTCMKILKNLKNK